MLFLYGNIADGKRYRYDDRYQRMHIHVTDRYRQCDRRRFVQAGPDAQRFAHGHAFHVAHVLSHGRRGRYERFVRVYGFGQLRRLGKLRRMVVRQLLVYRVVEQRFAPYYMSGGYILERFRLRRLRDGVLLSRVYRCFGIQS